MRRLFVLFASILAVSTAQAQYHSRLLGNGNIIDVSGGLTGHLFGDGNLFLNFTGGGGPTCTAANFFRGDGQCSSILLGPSFDVQNSNGTVEVGVASPSAFGGYIEWINAQAAANEKTWRVITNNSTLLFQTLNDALTTGDTWLSVSRTGTGINVNSLNFGNSTDNPTYTFNGAGVAAFNGVSTNAASAVINASTNPGFELRNTAAAANNQRWRTFVGSSNVQFGPCADDGVTCTVAVQYSRSGSTTNAIDINATAVRVNSSPVCTQNGTGCPATLTSGTYTPTCTTGTNVATCTISSVWNFMQVGNVVTVSGPVFISITASGIASSRFNLTPPVASAFSSNSASGTCTSINSAQIAGISADASTIFALFTSVITSGDNMDCIFTYRIQ